MKKWNSENPLAPDDAARLLTRVRVQCELPDGADGCWLWGGCTTENGRAHMNFMGRPIGVRRAVFEAHHGFAPPPGLQVIACGEAACVSPHCVHALPRQVAQRRAAERGAYSSSQAVRNRTLARRRNSRYSDDVIELARTMPGSMSEVGRELGMNKSYVRLLRLGRARMPMQGPWAGLGARQVEGAAA